MLDPVIVVLMVVEGPEEDILFLAATRQYFCFLPLEKE
jgi:hypothetical protein